MRPSIEIVSCLPRPGKQLYVKQNKGTCKLCQGAFHATTPSFQNTVINLPLTSMSTNLYDSKQFLDCLQLKTQGKSPYQDTGKKNFTEQCTLQYAVSSQKLSQIHYVACDKSENPRKQALFLNNQVIILPLLGLL